MYRCVRMKGMEGKREASIIGDVRESMAGTALDDDIPNIASFVDLRGVEGGALARLPSDDEVACFDPPTLRYQVETPRLFAYDDKACERRDLVRRCAVVQERALGTVVTDIGVTPIGPALRVGWNENLAPRKSRAEPLLGFDAVRQKI